MQLKYSFKKELSHFTHTSRIWGVIIAVFAFAVFMPLLCKAMSNMLVIASQNPLDRNFAAVSHDTAANAAQPGEADVAAALEVYSNAGFVFTMTLVAICSYSLLIIMLVLIPAAGGEQKKRAMIVPMCSGLKYQNYLIPKFVVYPLFVFVISFFGAMTAGGLCNSMFSINRIAFPMVVLAAFMCGVYMAFIFSVYLSLGICTSRPGVMTALVFVGQMLLQSILEGAGLIDYNPFTLLTLIGSGQFGGDASAITDRGASISVAVALSLAIIVGMYFFALGILNAKKIDNTQEDRPEF